MIPGGRSVVIELVLLSVFVTLIVAARFASRMIRTFSSHQSLGIPILKGSLLSKLKIFGCDDYIMLFNYALFVTVIYSIWVQILWGNNYVTAEDVVDWTSEDFHLAIMGSIFGIVMEICKVTCVWGCKASLLILYFSLTKGLSKYHVAVIIVSVYVAVGYVIVMAFLLVFWCRPFHLYYDTIPVPAAHGDAFILCLPIPLLINARLPLARFVKIVDMSKWVASDLCSRKCALIGVFSLGGLVILCAVLNRITNFEAPIGSLVYLNWYAGEISTAMIVANVPHLWPLIARIFKVGSFGKESINPSSGFTMHNMRNGSPAASQVTIAGDAQVPAYLENHLDLTGRKGSAHVNIISEGWKDDGLDPGTNSAQIRRTLVITQESCQA